MNVLSIEACAIMKSVPHRRWIALAIASFPAGLCVAALLLRGEPAPRRFGLESGGGQLAYWRDKLFRRHPYGRNFEDLSRSAKNRIAKGQGDYDDYRQVDLWNRKYGSLENRISYAKAAIEEKPSDVRRYHLLALAIGERSGVSNAKAVMRGYPKRNAEYYHWLGVVMEEMGDQHQACEAYQEERKLLERIVADSEIIPQEEVQDRIIYLRRRIAELQGRSVVNE